MLLKRIFFACIALCITVFSIAQIANTDTFFLAKQKGILGKIGKSMLANNSNDTLLTTKKISDNYIPFKGKLITRIQFKNVSFSGNVNDSLQEVKTFFTKLSNQLQPTTKEALVKNTLLFKTGDKVFPNLMADNERYLREQPFFQDARIDVLPNPYDTNTVTVKVAYKDVIAIGGNAVVNTNNIYANVENNNFMGNGERIGLETYFDANRQPRFGMGAFYSRTNIAGSFVNATIGFRNMAPTFNSNKREQKEIYTKLDLPLVSPFAVFAGGIEMAWQQTTNAFHTDSFYKASINYNLANYDAWIGYNISSKIIASEAIVRKVKHFVATRFVNRSFNQIPTDFKLTYNSLYADIKAILFSYTAFKQEYYRANYIYGFGRNEDIPKGFNISTIGGWVNRFTMPRWYFGNDIQFNFFSKDEQYYNTFLRTGIYNNKGKLQDGSIVIGIESFSRLRHLGNNKKWMMRHFINASFAQQINSVLDEPLRLNSPLGIPQFPFDSAAQTSRRISISCETVFFNQWKLAGFRFAPFVYVSTSYLKNTIYQQRFYGDVFTAIGAGVKTRNESLVFGTMELRALYYPKTIGNMQPFNIQFNTNLQFRYNSQYVKKPDVVVIN
jgi:hypothetical protein